MARSPSIAYRVVPHEVERLLVPSDELGDVGQLRVAAPGGGHLLGIGVIEQHEDAVGMEHREERVAVAAVDGPRVLLAELAQREAVGDVANVVLVGHVREPMRDDRRLHCEGRRGRRHRGEWRARVGGRADAGRAGSDVALTYHSNGDAAAAVVADVEAVGRRARAWQLDLVDAEATRDTIAEIAEQFGGIHTLVHAAGPHVRQIHLSRVDPAEFRQHRGRGGRRLLQPRASGHSAPARCARFRGCGDHRRDASLPGA